ncbi:hypothetical protein [Oceanivirga salmonicida]|uniref:hypothetical protein n=1 Tax=Oceanivirga salmonicida TaxID=1769291 RepID=UPI0012E1B52C|nr:hypothetical protein [Oceanivirga salmonicida]
MREDSFFVLMFYIYTIVLGGISLYFFNSFYKMIKFLKDKKIVFEVYILIGLVIIEIIKYIMLYIHKYRKISFMFYYGEIVFIFYLITVLAIIFINIKIFNNKGIEKNYRENLFRVSFSLLIISNLFIYFFILSR